MRLENFNDKLEVLNDELCDSVSVRKYFIVSGSYRTILFRPKTSSLLALKNEFKSLSLGSKAIWMLNTVISVFKGRETVSYCENLNFPGDFIRHTSNWKCLDFEGQRVYTIFDKRDAGNLQRYRNLARERGVNVPIQETLSTDLTVEPMINKINSRLSNEELDVVFDMMASFSSVKKYQKLNNFLSDIDSSFKAEDFELKEIPLSDVHGDFHDFNVGMTNEEFYVIDWEHLKEEIFIYDVVMFFAHRSVEGGEKFDKRACLNYIRNYCSDQNIDLNEKELMAIAILSIVSKKGEPYSQLLDYIGV